MKNVKFGFLAILGIGVVMGSCQKPGCTDETAFNFDKEAQKDDGTCKYENFATISFTQSWGGANVTSDDFNDIKYTNEAGTQMSITRLRYSISDVRFYKADGDSVVIDMYHLVDLDDASTLSRVLLDKLDPIEYTGIGFNFGFTPEDNINGAYADLNLATWGWPSMIGGGYHQMQLDGKFINTNSEEAPYNFHNGSTTKTMDSNEDPVPNYFFVKLDKTIAMNTDRTIEIDMQVDEWFRNPHTWDLDANSTMLMGNKAAQLLISANGESVFKIGEVN